jgi:hypothetical protein
MQNQRLIQSKNFVTRNDVNRFGKKNVKAVPKKTDTLEKNAEENAKMIHVKELVK